MIAHTFKTLGVELMTVTGGFQLPTWMTGERFQIPAADPPGHTLLRREWKQHPPR